MTPELQDNSTVFASRQLSAEATAYLRAHGEVRKVAAGDYIVRQGDPGETFYVVARGAIETVLSDAEGLRLSLGIGGAGHFFGEMSLLTGARVSANIIAKTDAEVLCCPRAAFETGLSECPTLRSGILAEMAQRLQASDSQLWGLFQRARAHATLMRLEWDSGPLVQESRRMQRLVASLPKLAAAKGCLVINGPPGSGKLKLARAIHCADNEEAPFIVAECRHLQAPESAQVLFGGDGTATGSGGFGLLHLAAGGTLVLRHVQQLDRECQNSLCRLVQAASDGPADGNLPRRIIATTSADLETLAKEDRFSEPFAALLSAQQAKMPALAERRADILPLAGFFLEQVGRHTHHELGKLSAAAELELLRAKWDYRNVDELHEAIRFAALFAGGGDIRPEHIFTGPPASDAPIETDISGMSADRHRVRRLLVGAARAGVFATFAVIIGLCLTAGARPAAAANSLTWGVWWPSLLLLFLIAGRLWCTVCPLATGARLARRLGTLGLAPPEWLKRHSWWLIAVLFVVIVWAEHVFHMTRHPVATGLLLLTLMALAAGFAVVFERDIWCRHLCPLGNLGAGYARGAMLQVHANPGICAARCQTHDCYKGNEKRPGCPVFHHPLYVRDAPFCKLCLECLDTCPNTSARLYMRLPMHTIWRQRELGSSLNFLACVVAALSSLMLLSVRLALLANPLYYTAAAVAAVGLGGGIAWALPRLFRREVEHDGSFVSRVAVALFLLAWGALMAFHLGNMPVLAQAQLQLPLPDFVWPGGHSLTTALLPVLQLAGLASSALLGMFVLWPLWRRARKDGGISPRGWFAFGALAATHLAVSTTAILMI